MIWVGWVREAPNAERSEILRIFVMGCSRSGTTLLQSLLANHSRVHTFPETGVFLKIFGMRGPTLPWAWVGLTVGKERKALRQLLAHQAGAPGSLPALPPRRVLLSRSVADVSRFLDDVARAHGKSAWVEKTPRHVLHARRISRVLPDAWCVHLIRKGEDVVASIVDRARQYPHRFPGQDDPSYGIRQWNRSVRATLSALGGPRQVVVFYETLAGRTEETLRHLSSILALEFETGMMTPAPRIAYAHQAEEWKSGLEGEVRRAPSKFGEMFDAETRARISEELDLKSYRTLIAHAGKGPEGILYHPPPTT